jgi:xylulokinase
MEQQMDYVLGIDVGTTGTKSALFSGDGKLVDIEYTSYPISYPEEGWAEQDPQHWWEALVKTTRAVVERTGKGSAIRSLSLSTQGGCLVLLDKKFTPVRPAVSWMDRRASAVSDQLVQRISVSELYHLCGWPVLDSLNFPTMFWFRQKAPELLQNVQYYASTIDYLNYLLTERFAIDYTNFALTGFLDLKGKKYAEKTMHIAGITADNLPEIVPSGKVVGTLSTTAAGKLGLSEEVLVVSGAHDRYCESIGAGAIHPGDCVLGAGTSWVLLATSDSLLFHKPRSTDRGFVRSMFPGPHPLEGKYGLMTVVPHGGNSLRWFRDVIRPASSFEQLNDDAAQVNIGAEGLMFIPISSSTSGKGSFQGIDGVHTISHFTRAVFEGVAFVNRIHFDLFRQAGLHVGKLIMIGGGTKSTIWPHIVADVCNVPVELPRIQEAACAGAAVLAAAGCGPFSSIEEGSTAFKGESSRIIPTKIHVEQYTERFEAFLSFLNRA